MLVNTSNFGVQWNVWTKLLFEKLVFFWNECPTHSRTLSVVWPGTELFKLYSTGSVKLYQGNFFWKTFIFAFVLDFWRSTCSHSAKTVCQGCQSCIVVGESNFVRRNIHFEENAIPCTNVSEFWEKNFCRNSCECFQNCCQNWTPHVHRFFLRKKRFSERIIFFKNGFCLLVRQFCRFSEFLLWGCQNCILRFWKYFFGKEVFFETNISFHKYFRNLWTCGKFSRKKCLSKEIWFVQLFWTLSYNGLNTGDLFFCRFVKLSLCMSRKLFAGRLFYFTKNGFLAMFRFCRLFLDRLAKFSKFGVQL